MQKLFEEIQCGFKTIGTNGVEIRVVTMFLDLSWGDTRPVDQKMLECLADPAVSIETKSRYVVLQRIQGALRFFAGPRAPQFSGPHELGTFETTLDAVALAKSYLAGAELSQIRVPRSPPKDPEYPGHGE